MRDAKFVLREWRSFVLVSWCSRSFVMPDCRRARRGLVMMSRDSRHRCTALTLLVQPVLAAASFAHCSIESHTLLFSIF